MSEGISELAGFARAITFGLGSVETLTGIFLLVIAAVIGSHASASTGSLYLIIAGMAAILLPLMSVMVALRSSNSGKIYASCIFTIVYPVVTVWVYQNYA